MIGFALAAAACGPERAPAAVAAYDRSLATLAAGDLRAAASAAEEAKAAGDPEVATLAAFLEGNVLYARAENAGRQADTPMAEPFAFDVAISLAKKARDRWAAAAMTREDWPAARRNVERALLLVAELEAKKAARQNRPPPVPEPKISPKILPPPPGEGEKTEEEIAAEAAKTELSPEEVRLLYERLAAKEREKAEIRRQRQREKSADVERDW